MELPVQNPTLPFWYDGNHPLHDACSTDQLPTKTDVVIMGAGYAGVATAYHLVKGGDAADHYSKKLSVTIIEALSVCSEATGCNGGHLRPDLYGHIPKYIDRFDPEAGEQLAKFEIEHVEAIRKLVRSEEIDCDFISIRSCHVSTNEEDADELKIAYNKMLEHGFSYMKDI